MRFQPVYGIQRNPSPAANLEMEMRPLIARPPADVPEGLAADHALTLRHGRVAQVPVEAVVAASMVDQHRREVGPERAGQAHGAGGHGPHRRPRGGRDADAVPRNARLVRARAGAEPIQQPSVNRPVELADIRGGDRGRGRRSARLRLEPGPLERRDPVVQALLVALELGEALERLARAAPGGAQRRLPLPLDRQVPVQLLGALGLAPRQGIACVDQGLALSPDPPLQLGHVVLEQAILLAHEKEVLVARLLIWRSSSFTMRYVLSFWRSMFASSSESEWACVRSRSSSCSTSERSRRMPSRRCWLSLSC